MFYRILNCKDLIVLKPLETRFIIAKKKKKKNSISYISSKNFTSHIRLLESRRRRQLERRMRRSVDGGCLIVAAINPESQTRPRSPSA